MKLLTYVSIFYLPLSFCAALWSINESCSTSAFAITALLIALTTYFLVSNLENAVSFVRSLYRVIKRPIIRRMVDDPDEKWAAKGKSFTSFRPDRANAEPSEWHIVLFLVVEILRKLGVVKTKLRQDQTDKPDDAKEEGEPVNPGSEPPPQENDKGKAAINDMNPDRAAVSYQNPEKSPTEEVEEAATDKSSARFATRVRQFFRIKTPSGRDICDAER